MGTYLNELSRNAQLINVFGGYNHTFNVPLGSFFEMENMSGEHYPRICTRRELENVSFSGVVSPIKKVLKVNLLVGGSVVSDCYAVLTNKKVRFYDSEKVFIREEELDVDDAPTEMIAQAGYLYLFPCAVRIPLLSDEEVKYLRINNSAWGAESTGGMDAAVSLIPMFNGADYTNTVPIVTPKEADGKNISRGANQLIIYTEAHSVNAYGTNAVVENNIVKSVSYGAFTAPTSGDFVISGHGTASTWISENIKVGNYINLTGSDTQPTINIYASIPALTAKPTGDIADGTVYLDKKNNTTFIYSALTDTWNEMVNNELEVYFKPSPGQTEGNVYEVYDINSVEQIKDGHPDPSALFAGFEAGDAVRLEGFGERDGDYVIKRIDRDENGNAVGIVLPVTSGEKMTVRLTSGEAVRLERIVPKLNYIVEHNNRLWGCYYGVHTDGSVINEIYCSALGEPWNWYKYESISSDSWTATVGADGEWTGAIVYGGYPVFFKENCIVRVYGTAPSSFQLATYNYRGVKKGSAESLCICDEILYYHSPDGFMAYTGGVPAKIDWDLGEQSFSNVKCASHKGLVYALCGNTAFVYDARRGFWHKWTLEKAVGESFEGVTSLGEELIFLKNRGVVRLGLRGRVEFSFESAELGLETFFKHLHEIKIRAAMSLDSVITVSLAYDGGAYEEKAVITATRGEPFEIPIKPDRCDRFKFKLSGFGNADIIGIYLEWEDE